MEILALLLGLAIGMAVQRVLGRRARPAPPPEGKPAGNTGAEAAPADAAPPADLTSRLLPLRKELEDFGETIAHPREIGDRAEFRQAVALLSEPSVETDVFIAYALGSNWPLSCAAFAALPARADQARVLAAILPRLKQVNDTALHFALQALCDVSNRPPVGAVLIDPDTYWHDTPAVLATFETYFSRRQGLGDAPTFGELLKAAQHLNVQAIEELLTQINHPYSAALREELSRWRGGTVNRVYLQSIGQFWGDEEQRQLVEHDAIREPLLNAMDGVTRTPPRSLLVVGEPRTGKTALLRLLARRLAAQKYQVFEASGAQVMAGQMYIGELEGRLRRLQAELSSDKRVLWYVPSFRQIVSSGTHRGQPASIFDQMLPSIVAGRIIIVSECTPGELVRIQQLRPTLANAMEIIRLRSITAEETVRVAREFIAQLEDDLHITIDANVVPAALQLTAQYLGGQQLPGAVIDLIKAATHRVIARMAAWTDLVAPEDAGSDEPVVTRESLLDTLSQLSGLPRVILDDREKTDLARLREFFATRVIGQDEAVGAIVDRIAMLKAGLTDPARPVGVFLFAGPTGTGKTELARTLAEYLFGTVERLIRLDMSEFQTSDSTFKILGGGDAQGETSSLVQKVRKQPFAVVLLDEFEKAHPNVWDLFLQVFDDARLTDSLGQVADFRHTLIILTSNLGATAHEGSGLGFTPRDDAFSQAQVLRAVSRNFRPEFVNRLDKVIVFRPLTRERMRDILLKELRRVLERRGLRDREWAVEWESSALDFLLDKGFSPALGAQPLKRAIDQHLLAPLAATMVEHKFPSGDQFLFVRSDGRAIQVEFVDPDAPDVAEGDVRGLEGDAAARMPAAQLVGASMPGLASTILQPLGTREEHDLLSRRVGHIESMLVEKKWEELRESITRQMAGSDFWDLPERHRVLARYALMDRVRAAARTSRSLLDRYERSARAATGHYSKDLAGRLASQVYLVEHGIRDVLGDTPVEVVVAVEAAMESGGDDRATQQWCERVFAMYCDWAAARRMQFERVTGKRGEMPLLTVAGFGAHTVLSEEVGLHVLETEGAGARASISGRSVARVRVAPTPVGPTGSSLGFPELRKLLDAQAATTFVVRRYRFEPSPLVRDARRGWRAGRVDEVLAGNFDLFAGEASK